VILEPALLDTGPMVAVASVSDSHHIECVDTLQDVRAPLYTCWPVVTEALWLLRQEPKAIDSVCRAFRSGLYSLLALDESDLVGIHAVLKR
jgi:hypothetical protein